MKKILNNANRRFFKIKYIFAVFLPVVFVCWMGCQTEHHDYYYMVKNSTNTTGAILLTYKLKEGKNTDSLRLEPDETAEIYLRSGVSGSGVWNIETSSFIYVLSSMTASNENASRFTEELSIRNFWPSAPESNNGNGIYTLPITDDLFVLEKQENYQYHIQNSTDDTLFVASSFGNIRKRDTIPSNQTVIVGEAEIFSYDETLKNTDKYIEKKLSGISSLDLTYREKTKKVNLRTDYKSLNINPEREKCTLIIEPSIFK